MYDQLKQQCYWANRRLPQLGLVLYTFGNVSCADRQARVFAIKPSGVEYSQMSPQDMVVVDFNGKVVEGVLRPSGDTATHAHLYREFENITSIVHTHSTYASAWAQALCDIPIYGTTHADHLPVAVPCTPAMNHLHLSSEAEGESGRRIVECFRERNLSPDEVPMVLVGGHGPFTWGRNVEKALYNARILEELAKMAQLTRSINPQTPVLTESVINRHYLRKHGEN